MKQRPSLQPEKCRPKIIIPLSLWSADKMAGTKVELTADNKCEESAQRKETHTIRTGSYQRSPSLF